MLTSSRAIALVYEAQASHPTPRVAANNRKAMIAKINQTASAPSRIQESAILLLGEYGRLAREEDLGDLLEPLVVRLGSASAPLRSAAYTQVSLHPAIYADARSWISVDFETRRHTTSYHRTWNA
jgi:hypothetical protein